MKYYPGEEIPKPSVIFWLVTAASLIRAIMAAFDYLGSFLHRAELLISLPEIVLTSLHLVPLWGKIAWGFGTWGALVGAVFMAMRSRHACVILTASLAGLAVTTVCQAVAPYPPELKLGAMLGLTTSNWAIAVFLVIYTFVQREQGVLR